MNFAVLWFAVLFCASTLAQDGVFEEGSCCQGPNSLTEKLKAMEARMQETEKQILELTNKERTNVIFSAATGGGDKNIGPFNTDTILIFTKVFTNVGNAYGQATGVFTAPVAGVYYFTIFFHAGGEHEGNMLLFKNQELMIMTHDHKSENDGADNGGNAVFLQLQRGDQVFVRLSANTHVWGSDFHTTFSGFLVTET